MTPRMTCVGLAALVVLMVVPCRANGQYGGYGWPYCCDYAYLGVYASEMPYFSLHPPVYYSYRVARTFGYSPFAYPPYVMTPGSEPAAATGQSPAATPQASEAPDGPQASQRPSPHRKPVRGRVHSGCYGQNGGDNGSPAPR